VGALITGEAQQQGKRRRPERRCAIETSQWRTFTEGRHGGVGGAEERRPIEGRTSSVQSWRGGGAAAAVAEQR